jgi:hypothetical protein
MVRFIDFDKLNVRINQGFVKEMLLFFNDLFRTSKVFDIYHILTYLSPSHTLTLPYSILINY